MTKLSLFGLLYLPALGLRSTSEKTPVGKVVELLEHLSQEISAEGAKEAANYDKFACFCKHQADLKTNNIAKSEEKIASLTATIDALAGEIAVLNQDVIDLGTRIGEIEAEVKSETETRDAEHNTWKVDDADMAQAIEAVRGAIEAMRNSKSQMQGAKLNGGELIQAKKLVVALLALDVLKTSTSAQQLHQLSTFARMPEDPGKGSKYVYQSNDIIATLEGLLVNFKKNKKELWDAEHAARTAFDTKILDLSNEKKFKTDAKNKKEAISAAKEEDKAAAEKEQAAESSAKDADAAFQTELTTQCETKASEWDERSKLRAKEITMLNEAAVTLKSAVDPAYLANKKLVGLVKKRSSVAKQRSVSFLQESSSARSTMAQVVDKAVKLLDAKAIALHSPLLSALASKASLQEDHFAKVRDMIRDLIQKLEDMAIAEADHKSFCDTKMEAAIGDRDSEQGKVEEHTATVDEKEAEKKQLVGEIATLSEEIAGLAKALREATELRSDEKLANDKTIADATAGKESIVDAIQILKDFYAFAQYTPPKSDRDAKTVGDLAPETWSGEYRGRQDASKGVIGLLEIIEADFERTITTVTQQEADAVKAFDKFKSETEGTMDAKAGEKTNKEGQVTTAEADIVEAQDSLKDARDLHAKALDELAKLRAMCVEGESYGDRKKAREAEIAALKQAMQILNDWQK